MNALDSTKRRLRSFGTAVATSSPLYSVIALGAAGDDEIATVAATAPDGSGQAMLLLAAVHWLLSRSAEPLRRFYPSLGGTEPPDPRTWPEFRDFVLDHQEAVRLLLRTRVVQTNDVQRAAVLYPLVAAAAARSGGAVGLLEVGCSSGLLLGLDRYRYCYRTSNGAVVRAGDPGSPVRFDCDVTGGGTWAAPTGFRVNVRVGLDRSPVDINEPEQLGWLESCVWADQPERVDRLRLAAAQCRRPGLLVAGDAVDDLAGTTALIPHEMPVVIITSWVLMYLPPAERTRFLNELDRLARRRRIWWVANETFESCLVEVAPQYADLAYTRTGQTALSLMGWDDRGWHVQVFGTAQVHGDAMTILDDEPTSDRSWFTEHRP